jgi:hypothetical protein
VAYLASNFPDGYVSGRMARQLLGGASAYTLQALALRGEVRTLVDPGRPPAYRREDVERLARSRQQPERAGA